MKKKSYKKKTGKKLTNADVYKMVNDKILEALESGINPWQKTWKALTTHGMPINLFKKTTYKGSNVLMLGMQDVPCQCWLTYKQCQDLGGNVKLGAKGTIVVYWNFIEVEDPNNPDKIRKIGFLRYYKVFNALRDCEGLEERVAKVEKPKNGKMPIANPDQVLIEWMKEEKIALNHGGDKAYYNPGTDCIQMPFESDFIDREHYMQVLAHEMIHSTGHAKRLARKAIVEFDHFGSEQYSFEELIAETGSTYVAASLGYEPDFDNTAAYLTSWKKKLKANPDWFVKASGKAEKAADYIVGDQVPEKEQKASQAA